MNAIPAISKLPVKLSHLLSKLQNPNEDSEPFSKGNNQRPAQNLAARNNRTSCRLDGHIKDQLHTKSANIHLETARPHLAARQTLFPRRGQKLHGNVRLGDSLSIAPDTASEVPEKMGYGPKRRPPSRPKEARDSTHLTPSLVLDVQTLASPIHPILQISTHTQPPRSPQGLPTNIRIFLKIRIL
ncbi:hypothetical protein CRM22_010829 [Opisthorchis felineus]|uniref:Uncharacterized protein n=1 Tax=Opisthorchis felineus TaxID=147828 RepID=A0A4S2KR30_OPIFE|nr:hypothetical protein CRM22_010829 [Opisthorchis felineus]